MPDPHPPIARFRTLFCFTIAAIDYGDRVVEVLWSPVQQGARPAQRRGPATPATSSRAIEGSPELHTLEAFRAWLVEEYGVTFAE